MQAEDKELQESRQLISLGLSAAVLAHELGNQLSGISLALQSLERDFAGKVAGNSRVAFSILHQVNSSVDRLTALVNEFCNLAHPPKLKLERTDLSSLLAELLGIEGPQYAARGIQVRLGFSRDLPPVMIDKDKFKQALLNVFKNAVEAMPYGGTLSLNAWRSGENVSIDIADNGIAVPEGLDIFQLFVSSKPNGMGLGLPIVRQIISAHGGTVEYISRAGQGTVFRLTLPFQDTSSQ